MSAKGSIAHRSQLFLYTRLGAIFFQKYSGEFSFFFRDGDPGFSFLGESARLSENEPEA